VLLAVLASAASVLVGVASLSSPADAAVPSLRTPAGMPSQIEPLAPYVAQVSCQPAFRKGTLALGRMLTKRYPNTSFGGNYNCGTDGTRSEHYDGRAVDWMDSVRNPTQKAQATSVLNFLLGTDKAGHKFANARRLGVMYIIYNNRIWGSWDGKWSAYNNCAKTPSPSLDSSCHRNHMHISLSFNGALARTSFWTRHVYADDYGPCRSALFNWSANYTRPNLKRCAPVKNAAAPKGSSAIMKGLVQWSGIAMRAGMAGPAVAAVQRGLRVPVTSTFDARTTAALNRLKRAHRLPGDGVMNGAGWKLLLAVNSPKR
jgi:hypothetical protein